MKCLKNTVFLSISVLYLLRICVLYLVLFSFVVFFQIKCKLLFKCKKDPLKMAGLENAKVTLM